MKNIPKKSQEKVIGLNLAIHFINRLALQDEKKTYPTQHSIFGLLAEWVLWYVYDSCHLFPKRYLIKKLFRMGIHELEGWAKQVLERRNTC